MKAQPSHTFNRWMPLLALTFVIVMIAYPVTLLLIQSVIPEILAGDFRPSIDAYIRIFTSNGVAEMLWNSLRWAGATTLIAWLIGLPCGWILARVNLTGKTFIRLLFLVPIMMPPYVFALSYTLLMLPGGLGDSALGGVPESWRDLFFSFWGVAFVMAICCFGYVTLAIEAALRAMPLRLEHAAFMLGASPIVVFRSVIFPLLIPALLNTGVLVFLDAISNFGVPAILGPRANLPLLPAEIYSLVTSWPLDFPLATSLSSLLLVAAVITLFINQRLLARSAMHTSARTQSSHTEGNRTSLLIRIIAWCILSLVFLFALGLPCFAVVLGSLVDRWNDGAPTLTLQHYRELLTPGSRGLSALWTSLWLSLAAATICTIVGGLIAYIIVRGRGLTVHLLDATAILPRVLPKIVVAVALIMAWNAPWMGAMRVDVYGTVWMLLVAYVALYLSDSLRFSDAGMRRISVKLEHAAESIGATRWQSLRYITLPLLWPSLLAGWLTTFVACMRDLVASVILLPPGVETAGSFIFNQFEQGDIAAAMAMATLIVLLGGTVLAIAMRLAPRG